MSGEWPEWLVRARVQLMLEEPYLGAALARLGMVDATEGGWCPTMATDGVRVFFHRGFCEGLSPAERVFVLAHELLHCVLGHEDRRGARDPELWNIAADYATNLMLHDFGFRMPADGLLDGKFKDMTSEQIYRELQSRKKNGAGGGGLLGESGGWGRFDQHLSAQEGGWHAHDGGTLSEEEREWMRRELRRELVKEGQGRGILRGGFRGELAAAVSEEVPWQAVLAQFMSSVRKDDYRLMPPNRRHVWQGIYLPSLGRPGVENLVVVIDTSGSMSEEQLRKVLGEIEHLRATVDCRVTLLQVDAAVADAVVYETYEAIPFGKFTVAGRGGTAFQPAFEWVAQRQREECMHVDALIYLTDGHGTFPEAPLYPTLWIYVNTRADDPPFGRVLRIGR